MWKVIVQPLLSLVLLSPPSPRQPGWVVKGVAAAAQPAPVPR